MTREIVTVPDLGGAEEVEVIEVSVAVGDMVEIEQTLVVLESDKAMMEIPAPFAGKILKLFVHEEDKIEKQGDPLVEMEVSDQAPDSANSPGVSSSAKNERAVAQNTEQKTVDELVADKTTSSPQNFPLPKKSADNFIEPTGLPELAETKTSPPAEEAVPEALVDGDGDGSAANEIYAGPAVRQLARELGVNLRDISGSGPRGRLLKDDVQAFVKKTINSSGATRLGTGSGIPAVPDIDFAQFGETEQIKMSKIARLTASNMHRSWLNVPHVTQFDDADITELEEFRQSLKAEGESRGVKMTPVPIILKACAVALVNNPVLNRSLRSDGKHYIQKYYIHIGVAVDTPRGLMVPVLRDVDKKSLWQLAIEVAELAGKARDGKLSSAEMQGGCFTVSSLGVIGGQGFTPVVNTPQVAILGVSKAQIKPLWNGSEFVPRNMLPLALSYDHRAVNGGDAGRFMTELVSLLGDIRRFSL